MISATPALSVLLPTYNGERFLREQIDSILEQSVENLELLIIDDGSTDGTVEVCDAYARQDRRVRIVRSEGNRGQKLRLWQLVGEARAQLLTMADQDDVWHVDRSRCLLDGLGDAAMSYGRSDLVDALGAPTGGTLIRAFGPQPTPGDRLTPLFYPRVSAHGLLVRRDAVSEMAFRRYQPFDWLMGVEAAFGRGLVYVDDAVVRHRIHGGNQSNADAGVRRPLAHRLKPGPLYLQLHSTQQTRAIFVELLEHLAHSPLLLPAITGPLMRAALQCRLEWFIPGTGNPWMNPGLNRLLRDTLEPLAGSDQDVRVADEFIDRMTRSQFHPRSLREIAGRVFTPTSAVKKADV